jgi:hypothetical protein
MTIELKYVALSPLHIQEMVSEGIPLLDEDGRYVFTDYKSGDEVPAASWGQKVVSRMIEYRRILPVAAGGSATVEPHTPRAAEVPYEAPPSPTPTVTSYASDELATEREFPYHYGGPWYELSDGTRVKGKQAADLAEAALVGA